MRRWANRSALTLLEVMIVLAISVSLFAIAWPQVQKLTERSVLKQAALDVKSRLAETRDRAIRQGTVTSFHYRPNEPGFWIESTAISDANDFTIRGSESSSEGRELSDLDRTALKRGMNGPPKFDAGELPDDVKFVGSPDQVTQDQMELSVRQTPNREDLVKPHNQDHAIQFFADGRATSATIRLFSPELARMIAIEVRGLTGGATIGPIERMELDGADDRALDGGEPSVSYDDEEPSFPQAEAERLP